MAGKAPDDKTRSRKLLSDDAIPKIEIPRSNRGPKREFKLPDEISAPIPSRDPKADQEDREGAGSKRRRRSSTGRFKERTLGWFKTGEDLEKKDEVAPDETGEMVRDQPSGLPLALILGGVGVVAVVALILWLS